MAVSRRLRFEILRRDNHACRYCGRAAPDVALTVDHVVPVTLGGGDEPANLVAACADCNSGKSSIPADAAIVENVRNDAIRWAWAMREAAQIAAEQRQLRDAYREDFDGHWGVWTWGDRNGERHPVARPTDWPQTIDQLVAAGLDTDTMLDAINIAMRSKADDTFRYFCGVCWRSVTKMHAVARQILDVEDGD